MVSVAIAIILIGAWTFAAYAGLLPWSGEHSEATVTIVSDDGEQLAVVDAEVADTKNERITGLSEHDSLEEGEGMLFVHDDEDDRTYVMRNMSFGIDIVFVDADGEITEIHEARAPKPGEDGEEMRYSGAGMYVLEVPKGYMATQNATVGDRIEIEYHEDEEHSDRNR